MNRLQSAMLFVRLFGWRTGAPRAAVFLIGCMFRRSEKKGHGETVKTATAL
jgi:hypothetical protein